LPSKVKPRREGSRMVRLVSKRGDVNALRPAWPLRPADPNQLSNCRVPGNADWNVSGAINCRGAPAQPMPAGSSTRFWSGAPCHGGGHGQSPARCEPGHRLLPGPVAPACSDSSSEGRWWPHSQHSHGRGCEHGPARRPVAVDRRGKKLLPDSSIRAAQ